MIGGGGGERAEFGTYVRRQDIISGGGEVFNGCFCLSDLTIDHVSLSSRSRQKGEGDKVGFLFGGIGGGGFVYYARDIWAFLFWGSWIGGGTPRLQGQHVPIARRGNRVRYVRKEKIYRQILGLFLAT